MTRWIVAGFLIMIALAATLRALLPHDEATVVVAIYATEDGPELTKSVQYTVGFMPDNGGAAAPNLGKLRVIRTEPYEVGTYVVPSHSPIHVYVIGKAPDPLLFSFVPGHLGHRGQLRIVLDETSDRRPGFTPVTGESG